MSQVHTRTDRPEALQSYEYLRRAETRDWAWEYLRRNPDYRSDALRQHRRGVVRRRLSSGALLTRLGARHIGAEAWGLCCFRRSEADG